MRKCKLEHQRRSEGWLRYVIIRQLQDSITFAVTQPRNYVLITNFLGHSRADFGA